jgi:2-oxoglutarate ferredoxin oxidoreductase subunit beta
MMREYKEKSIPVKEAEKLTEEELQGKIVVGEFIMKDIPEMVEEIRKMKHRASGEKK